MVKTAGVLTSCKRINSKRTIASESTASEPLQANHCEVSREGKKQGKKENIHEICNQA